MIFVTKARKEKMPKIKLNPLFAGISGTMGDFVFKTSRNGQVFISRRSKKSNATPSEAQKAQRQKMARATAYAKLAIQDPEIRQFYVQMAKQRKKNTGRPFDMAVSDYCQGNDLLWQKLMGDQEKPADWSWDPEQLPPVAGS
jgi:hypothetical protein